MTLTISVTLSLRWGVCTPTFVRSFSQNLISMRNLWLQRIINYWSTRGRRVGMMWYVRLPPCRLKLTTLTMRPTKKYSARWKWKTPPGVLTTWLELKAADRLRLLKIRITRQALTRLAQNRSWYVVMATLWPGSEGSDPYTHHIRVLTRIWADSSRSMLAGLLHNHCTLSRMVLGPLYLNLMPWSRLKWERQEMASVFHLLLRPWNPTTLMAWWRPRSRRAEISWRQRA